MTLRLSSALAVGRIAGSASRRLHLGGATVLPGHVASWVDPSALRSLASQLPQGIVLITGTNGKTTTARMVASITTAAGLRPVHNRAGANLPAGVLSALISQATLRGRLRGDLGVFEVDEAHLPAVAEEAKPRAVVLTNLFRDQLDRYGEIDLLANAWRQTAEHLAPSATLVLNVDDPMLGYIAQRAQVRVVSFGVDGVTEGCAALAHEADHRLCPACGAPLDYSWCYYGHLGHYACIACGWQRPSPDFTVVLGNARADEPRDIVLVGPDGEISMRAPLAGLYNVYNVAAAAATARALQLPTSTVKPGIQGLKAAFGRQERIAIGRGHLTLLLVKNPVGCNQALTTLPATTNLVVMALNDHFADGTDVSWIWDVDAEMLAQRDGALLATGTRAHDLAVRLKYASAQQVEVEPQLPLAIGGMVGATDEGSETVLLATYTAMLEARHELQRRGYIPPFWED